MRAARSRLSNGPSTAPVSSGIRAEARKRALKEAEGAKEGVEKKCGSRTEVDGEKLAQQLKRVDTDRRWVVRAEEFG